MSSYGWSGKSLQRSHNYQPVNIYIFQCYEKLQAENLAIDSSVLNQNIGKTLTQCKKMFVQCKEITS